MRLWPTSCTGCSCHVAIPSVFALVYAAHHHGGDGMFRGVTGLFARTALLVPALGVPYIQCIVDLLTWFQTLPYSMLFIGHKNLTDTKN